MKNKEDDDPTKKDALESVLEKSVERLPLPEHLKEELATMETRLFSKMTDDEGWDIQSDFLAEMLKLGDFPTYNDIKIVLVFQDHPEWAPSMKELLPLRTAEEIQSVFDAAKYSYDQKLFNQARHFCSSLCIIFPNNTKFLTFLGDCLEQLNQQELAQMVYSRAKRALND